jgi:hypothetical protein
MLFRDRRTPGALQERGGGLLRRECVARARPDRGQLQEEGGDPILIEGRLQYRTWEAQDGSKRSKVDVVADNVQFPGRPGGAENAEDGDPSRGRA